MPFLDDGLNQAIGETIAGGIQAALRGLRTRIDAGPLRVGTNARNVVRSSPKSGPPQLPKCRSPAASPGGGASVFLGGVEVGSARAACLWRGGHGRRRTSGNRSSSPAAGWWRGMRASCPATGGCWTRTRWSRSSPGSGRAMTHARASASLSAPPSSRCGMEVDVGPGTPSASADGCTEYFCSEKCRDSFRAAPRQLVARSLPATGASPPDRHVSLATGDARFLGQVGVPGPRPGAILVHFAAASMTLATSFG